jgi:ubiquinone/menaquinone biosynthesis C-methylase UbiE
MGLAYKRLNIQSFSNYNKAILTFILTMKKNMDREKYWNVDYTKYWKKRVCEANFKEGQSKVIIGDNVTIKDSIYSEAISLLTITKKDTLLEIGCGFGRSLPELCRIAKKVTASDISESMISSSKENKERNLEFAVTESENMPFSSNYYNVVICFAAFDAMYQTKALIEINRVCKIGGRVLITGKSDCYFINDRCAIEAEIGARKKGHPNYFTDVRKLVNHINDFGFTIESERYFLRRGDFSNNNFCNSIQDNFYEYLFILKKVKKSKISKNIKISNFTSKTYRKI